MAISAASSKGAKTRVNSGYKLCTFRLKIGLDSHLDSHLGGHRRIGTHPHKVKKFAKIGFFEPISPPLIPKMTPLKSLLKFA